MFLSQANAKKKMNSWDIHEFIINYFIEYESLHSTWITHSIACCTEIQIHETAYFCAPKLPLDIKQINFAVNLFGCFIKNKRSKHVHSKSRERHDLKPHQLMHNVKFIIK